MKRSRLRTTRRQAARIDSSVGPFVAHFSARGLARLEFPASAGAEREMDVEPLPSTKQMQVWQRLTALALRAALAGKSSSDAPPLDLSAGTPFQQKVWRALREIPLGQTRSYSEIAAAVDHPRAVRAVGGACGANPIPVLVPCHRVLAQGGKLGGFSAGLGWKERLLECEGVRLGQAARRFETAQ